MSTIPDLPEDPTLASEFKIFCELPDYKRATAAQLQAMEEAFYAGAICTIQILMTGDDDVETTLLRLKLEVLAFAQKLMPRVPQIEAHGEQ